MRIKDGFVMRDVVGQTVVIATGTTSEQTRSMITLNDTGKFIWKALSQESNTEDIVTALCAEYEVDVDQARHDVNAFIDQLRTNGLLED